MKKLFTVTTFFMLCTIGVIIVGCGSESPPEPEPTVAPTATPAEATREAATETATPAIAVESTPTSATSISIYNEAPQLAELVAAGDLPRIDERLPKNPMLVQPVKQIGRYGGTWHMGMRSGGADQAMIIRTIGYENLVRWNEQWTQIMPNIAQFYEASDTATEFSFRLREGTRWSDGAPFTVDDILFWYEDILLNQELNVPIPDWLTSGSEVVKVEKVDDYTVIFRFATPKGLFLQEFAQPKGRKPTNYPRHYLEQFHIKYNPDGIDELMQEARVEHWTELFKLKVGQIDTPGEPDTFVNTEMPTLNAWALTQGYTKDAQEVVAKRNPYYWKVDVAGNQLPYIDRVVYQVHDTTDELVELALNGEINMQSRHIAAPENKALFEENMEKNAYHFFALMSSFSNTQIIYLNMVHPDPVKREIFRNKEFRIGLSHAINRQAIIDDVLGGIGEPYQTAPRPESPFYHERLARQYTEYNMVLANQRLDKAGYKERDEEGFRVGPDGKRISFVIDVADTALGYQKMMEWVQRDWRAVGIDLHVHIGDRKVLYERQIANKHDAVAWYGGNSLDVLLSPRDYFPHVYSSFYAVPWAYWYENPDKPLAEVPPEATQKQMALYDQLKATSDPLEQETLMNRILEIAAEQFYSIGISLEGQGYGIVGNNFHNVPAFMPFSWAYPNPAPTNPCQYFINLQE